MHLLQHLIIGTAPTPAADDGPAESPSSASVTSAAFTAVLLAFTFAAL